MKVADLSNEELDRVSEEIVLDNVRDEARQYTFEAVAVLASLMRDKKNSASVRRQAANDLLNQGWGRPDHREDKSDKGNKLTIVINKLSTGEMHRVTTEEVKSDMEEAKRIVDALQD